MISPTQIRKPENWQDFEKLCKKLWGEIWNCSSSIKRNGRNGQEQCGVDIYGVPAGEIDYYGIQCKGKDENLNASLTIKEVEEEIQKAKEFKPELKKLIFATSSNKDVKIEEYIREKDLEHRKSGKFSIELACWGDIVDFLEEYKATYSWYVNNCQYKDTSDVDVTFNDAREYEVFPKYIRTTTEYVVTKEINPNGNLSNLLKSRISLSILESSQGYNINDILNPKRKIDYRWCTIPIKISNIGSTVIEDYKVLLTVEGKKIEKISDNFRYLNPGPLYDQSVLAIKNNAREKKREVFESEEYSNVIQFIPLNALLVQSDNRTFEFRLKPKDDVVEIIIQWRLLSRDYKKEGELILRVKPDIEDKYITREVDVAKEKSVEITPKIIEE